MKNIFKNTIGLSIAASLLALSACTQSEAEVAVKETVATHAVSTIKVNVSGYKTQEGEIVAALYDEEGYDTGKMVRGAKVAVDGSVVKIEFKDVPAGEYAIRMFRDVDVNGDLNMNAFGIPSEPFAFSNNARGHMGPAKWEQAKFDAVTVETVQSITID